MSVRFEGFGVTRYGLAHAILLIQCSLLLSMASVRVEGAECRGARDGVCGEIRKLYLSGDYKKYSVPISVENEDGYGYELDVNGDGKLDFLYASCGNGMDAICDIKLSIKDGEQRSFIAPISLRVIDFKGRIMLVTGLTISSANKVVAKDYSVTRVYEKENKIICKKF